MGKAPLRAHENFLLVLLRSGNGRFDSPAMLGQISMQVGLNVMAELSERRVDLKIHLGKEI
jgi:hypothetical protein